MVRSARSTRSSRFSVLTNASRASFVASEPGAIQVAAVIAIALQDALKLSRQGLVEPQPVLLGTGAQKQIVQIQQTGQFSNRLLVVIHPQIDEHVRQAAITTVLAGNDHGRRLTPASIATGRLPGLECAEKAPRQLSGGDLEGRCHRIDGLRSDQEIPLAGVAAADAVSRPLMARGPRYVQRRPRGRPRLQPDAGLAPGRRPSDARRSLRRLNPPP